MPMPGILAGGEGVAMKPPCALSGRVGWAQTCFVGCVLRMGLGDTRVPVSLSPSFHPSCRLLGGLYVGEDDLDKQSSLLRGRESDREPTRHWPCGVG